MDRPEAGDAAPADVAAGSAAPAGPLRGVPDAQALSVPFVLICNEYLRRLRDI